MIGTIEVFPRACLSLALFAVAACGEPPTGSSAAPSLNAVKFWEDLASARWNERAAALLTSRPPANGQAAASRVFTYLSVAQYRAVLAAEAYHSGSTHPSVEAAVGAASAVILSAMFPLDTATIKADLARDLASPGWPGGRTHDRSRGEALGRDVGLAIVALAASDNYLQASPGTPPAEPGYWVSSGASIVRALYGTRPFFMRSPDQLRPPPPPAFGSSHFLSDLAEVRAISDSRTAEQLGVARSWNANSGAFTTGALNQIALELIRSHHRTEREAARILAYANAAAFDAHIACFEAKFTYWFLRPSHADPAITLPIGLPNHPSYPSGHSCLTSAIMTVLIDAFPGERGRLEAIMVEAGMSRVFGGIHYRFDIEAGQAIGRGAAGLALRGSLE